ncbi:MAG: hypothetical protein MZW92_02500 [Comamonadaceae bacterium]|nr:hypothetical protein [Comamonadaceae bacterium]
MKTNGLGTKPITRPDGIATVSFPPWIAKIWNGTSFSDRPGDAAVGDDDGIGRELGVPVQHLDQAVVPLEDDDAFEPRSGCHGLKRRHDGRGGRGRDAHQGDVEAVDDEGKADGAVGMTLFGNRYVGSVAQRDGRKEPFRMKIVVHVNHRLLESIIADLIDISNRVCHFRPEISLGPKPCI